MWRAGSCVEGERGMRNEGWEFHRVHSWFGRQTSEFCQRLLSRDLHLRHRCSGRGRLFSLPVSLNSLHYSLGNPSLSNLSWAIRITLGLALARAALSWAYIFVAKVEIFFLFFFFCDHSIWCVYLCILDCKFCSALKLAGLFDFVLKALNAKIKLHMFFFK